MVVHVFVQTGGTTDVEKARVDMMADGAMDFRNGLVMLCYNPSGVSFHRSTRKCILTSKHILAVPGIEVTGADKTVQKI